MRTTKTTQSQNIAQAIAILTTYGFTKDKFGHYVKTLPDGTKYRYKFQAISLRKETWGKESNCWIRVRSCHYSSLRFKDNKIVWPRQGYI